MPDFNTQSLIKVVKEKAKSSFFYLLKKWYFLVLAVVVGAAYGYFSVRNVKPTYTASIVFVLSTGEQRAGGVAGLASQLGFDATSGSDNIFSGDNIIELFKSRSLIGSALLSEVDSTIHTTLLNYLAKLQFNAQYKKLGPFNNNPKTYNKVQTGLYRNIIGYVGNSFLVFKKDKKLIFYNISATASDPNAAYYIAKAMLDETSRYFIDTKTKVAIETVALLKHEADSLGSVLNNTYSSTAAMIDRTYNLNPSISIQRSGSQFNQAKATAFSAAYAEVMRNLESSKMNLQKETPLYKIIDEPDLPIPPVQMDKLRHVIIITIAAFLSAFLLLIAIHLYKSLSTTTNDNIAI
jgi:hypothetical protein